MSRVYSVGVMSAQDFEAVGRIVFMYLRTRGEQIPPIPQPGIISIDWRLMDSLDLTGPSAEQYKQGIKQLSLEKAWAAVVPY